MITADNLQVQYIPDDAYYYLTLARNFSSLDLWTFDSGISVTSGFHPLFAYLLSGGYSLLQLNASNFVILGIILSLLFACASVVTMLFWGFKHKNSLFLIFLALIISSQNFVYNTVSVTEWSLTVLISSIYYVWFFTKYEHEIIKTTDFLVLFVLGLLGSIARADFGLFPFSIMAATLIISLIIITTKRQVFFAFAGLSGTITGVLLLLGHNYIFTNEFLQSSAKMKAYWAQLSLPNYYAAPLLVGNIIGLAGLLLLAILIAIAVLPKFINKQNGRSNPNNDTNQPHHKQNKAFDDDKKQSFFIMIIAAGVCILGYTLVYARNGAIQPWYTGNLILPVLMLIFGVSDYIIGSLHEKSKTLFSLLSLIAILFNISNIYPINENDSPWPHQKIMLNVGNYLNKNTLNARVGAWNAGIIGYYEGGNIINLDGLVNNDIFSYAVDNRLPAYLESRDITYIVDFENMITSQYRRIRGGYDDEEFLATLKPHMVFDEGIYQWNYLTLYYIEIE